MKLAIMQPYFFPYVGYFQLINAVDKFIFYDDVNFIKRGWINRNKILINNEAHYLTIQLKGASQNKPINEIEILDNRFKLLKTIQLSYAKAPYFEYVFPVIEKCLNADISIIGELAITSVQEVCKYLEINTVFEKSGTDYPETKSLDRTERIISICNSNKADTYINAIGGKDIYTTDIFALRNIQLFFIKPNNVAYKQFGDDFVPWLSIIDLMMFNERLAITNLLNQYNLE